MTPPTPQEENGAEEQTPEEGRPTPKVRATAPGRHAEKNLMETLEEGTTPAGLIALIGSMLAFPVVLSLGVKFLVLPYLFPNW